MSMNALKKSKRILVCLPLYFLLLLFQGWVTSGHFLFKLIKNSCFEFEFDLMSFHPLRFIYFIDACLKFTALAFSNKIILFYFGLLQPSNTLAPHIHTILTF